MEEAFLTATILIEAPIVVAVLRGTDWRRAVWTCTCVNLLSHPIAWMAVSRGVSWWTVEAVVLVFESALFALLFPESRARAAAAAAIANMVSAGIGMLLF